MFLLWLLFMRKLTMWRIELIIFTVLGSHHSPSQELHHPKPKLRNRLAVISSTLFPSLCSHHFTGCEFASLWSSMWLESCSGCTLGTSPFHFVQCFQALFEPCIYLMLVYKIIFDGHLGCFSLLAIMNVIFKYLFESSFSILLA